MNPQVWLYLLKAFATLWGILLLWVLIGKGLMALQEWREKRKHIVRH